MACSMFPNCTFGFIVVCLSTSCAQSVKTSASSQYNGAQGVKTPPSTKQSESIESRFIDTNWSAHADASRHLERRPWSSQHQDLIAIISGFKAGVQECIRRYNFKTDQPIVISSVDSWYNEITKKWAARNKHVGVEQYLLVALDDQVADMAASLGYPALSSDGTCIHTLARRSRSKRLGLPGLLPSSKFIVPALLLGEGFQRVVFSEMDVFFRVNPFEATKMYEGHFLAMASPYNPDMVNIGFMEFRAPGAPNEVSKEFIEKLTAFSIKMLERKEEMKVRGFDQLVFNKYIKYYKMSAGTLFYPTLLNSRSPELFAVHPQTDTEITKILHYTDCGANPQCKIDKLNALYASDV